VQFLYRRPDSPYWWVRYKGPDGKIRQRSTRCRDKGAARRFLREWVRAGEHAAADEEAGIERPSDITLVDLAAMFLAEMERTRRPSYVKCLRTHLRVRILPYFEPETAAASISRIGVEGFRRSLLSGTAPGNSTAPHFSPQAPMSVATVQRYMVTLSRVFDFGVRLGELRDNPAARLPTLKADEVERHRALSEPELEAWLEQLREDDARWVRFMVATGLRDGEAARLRWSDIELGRSVMIVRGVHSKSRKSRRVPLTRAALEVLAELPNDRVGLVFGSKVRRKRLGQAWTAAGFGGRFPTAHDLRHTFASWAIAKGLDLEELREVMGHRSVVTTQRYLSAYGDRWERMAEKLDGGA
jgi:integrase